MLAKTSVQQQTSRRTPLSLGPSSMKPIKANDKNDNNKRETTNNQKTEQSKKDFSKRSSSTSSTDSKKLEGNNKTNKNEDPKKNQNGVNGSNNETKDKPVGNEAVAKTKSESSSNGNAPKKETQKSQEKKKDTSDGTPNESDNKKETKNEENKNKATEKNKEKPPTEVSNTPKLEEEKKKNKNEEPEVVLPEKDKKNDEKMDEEKSTPLKTPEKVEVKKTDTVEQAVVVVDLDSSTEKEMPFKNEMTDEITVLKTPVKENKIEEATKVETKDQTLSEDVVMMEPLQFTDEPASGSVFAVSTPAKNCSPKDAQILFEAPSQLSPKSEVKPARPPLTHTPDRKYCPTSFSAISGRRSIRPIGDYTFRGNLQIRESYRKINTELDFTTSSMNVTVGSEVPNNDSFSFFTRSRKRDRSSPVEQSSMEVQNEPTQKSPKRRRIDSGVYGFFNAMASPITMLRTRFARASVQSTPKKQIMDSIEQEIVENVSAIAVEAVGEEQLTATEEQTFDPDSTVADTNKQFEEPAKCPQQPPTIEPIDDIKIKETITATDSQAKKKCSIM